MYRIESQKERPSSCLQIRLRRSLSDTDRVAVKNSLTLHCHSYSSVTGGTIGLSFCNPSSGSSAASRKGGAGAPRFCTAGIPFFSQRSFKVKRGPISCNAAFSMDRNAYLTGCGISTTNSHFQRETNLCLLKNKKSRWLCSVTTCRPSNSGSCGKSVWNILPTAWPNRVTKPFRISSGLCGVALAWPYQDVS
jgi:hypothetical protein